MRRNNHLRLAALEVPANVTAAHLFLLTFVARPTGLYEGFLAADIRIASPIRLKGDREDRGFIFISAPVIRIEAGFVLTEGGLLYQISRVPVSISCDREK